MRDVPREVREEFSSRTRAVEERIEEKLERLSTTAPARPGLLRAVDFPWSPGRRAVRFAGRLGIPRNTWYYWRAASLGGRTSRRWPAPVVDVVESPWPPTTPSTTPGVTARSGA